MFILTIMPIFKYKELTEQILGAAFEVHNTLGCGFLEKVYENALVYELKQRGLKVTSQKEIKVSYKSQEVGLYVCDILVGEQVIVEVKAVEGITGLHQAQLLNYLKGSGYEVGLILNFGKPKLEYKRLVV